MADVLNPSIKKYEDLLKRARTGSSSPTQQQVFLEGKIMELRNKQEAQKSEKLKQEWYDDSAGERPAPEKGYVRKVLHGLGVPLYTVIGALESTLGKGSEPGLIENIKANIKEEGTAGDLLRSYGVGNLAAIPLGFALDIALDPVSWAVLGARATIPRVAMGLVKGGPRGAVMALKSQALTRAEAIGRFVPGLTKKAFGGTIPTTKFASLYKEIAGKAYASRAAYQKMIGKEIPDVLAKISQRTPLGTKILGKMEESAFGRGVKKLFHYDPVGYNMAMRAADSSDDINRVARTFDAVSKNVDDFFSSQKTISSMFRSADGVDNVNRMIDTARETKYFQRSVQDTLIYLKKLFADSKYIAKLEKLGMNTDELRAFHGVFEYYSTKNIDSYNKVVAKALLSKSGRKLLDAYAKYIGIFKSMKVGVLANPASVSVASVGNVSMTALAGKSVDSVLLKRVAQSAKLIISKNLDSPIMKEILNSDDLMRSILNHPALFAQITGVDPDTILMGRATLNALSRGHKADDIVAMNKIWDSTLGKIKLPGGFNINMGVAGGGPDTAFLVGEVVRGPYGQWMQGIKEAGEKGNKLASIYYKFVEKSTGLYGTIDQSHRLGFIVNMVVDGVTEKDLLRMAPRFMIGSKNVTGVVGRNLYRISADKAIDIATETYLNYLALPDFVKIMRTIPFVGFPFGSFTYAMGTSALKALKYNPAFYNKLNFLLKEMASAAGPSERSALESKYYSWMTQPGMVRLPFLTKNPFYFNIANMVPHYGLNFLQDPERTYEDKFGGKVAAMIDRLPILKTPEGQVLFDYLIQPLALGIERPQGMFGQPLWTKSAGFGEKIGRTGLSLVESVLPPSIGLLGLATPEAALPYLPSYRWRQLGYAMRGKTGVGVKGKESAASRTLRVLGSISGLPVYQAKIQYGKK